MKRKKRYADGGGVDEELVVEGMRPQNFNLASLARGPASGGSRSSGGGSSQRANVSSTAEPGKKVRFGKTYSPAGPVYGPEFSGDGYTVGGGYSPRGNVVGGRYSDDRFSAGLGYDPHRGYVGGDLSVSFKKGGKVKKMAKGGKLTDLTGDGKVTRADVLKGRGVPGFSKGGSTASKRADGCATKGKTKGRFV